MKSLVCSCLICIFVSNDRNKKFIFTSHFWARSTVISRDVGKGGRIWLTKDSKYQGVRNLEGFWLFVIFYSRSGGGEVKGHGTNL